MNPGEEGPEQCEGEGEGGLEEGAGRAEWAKKTQVGLFVCTSYALCYKNYRGVYFIIPLWKQTAEAFSMHCVKVFFSLFSYVCACFAKITCIRSRTCKTMAKLTSFTPQHTGTYKYTHFDNIYIVFFGGREI